MIETQIYSLPYVAGGSVLQQVSINVPFVVRKLVFKPISLIIPPGVTSPNAAIVMFSNLYDVNRAIGYSGYYNSVSNGGYEFYPSITGANVAAGNVIGIAGSGQVISTGTAIAPGAIVGTVVIAGVTFNVASDGAPFAAGTICGQTVSTFSNIIYVQPAHDITFQLRSPKDINGTFQFYIGSALTGGLLQTAPATCSVLITIEYHS